MAQSLKRHGKNNKNNSSFSVNLVNDGRPLGVSTHGLMHSNENVSEQPSPLNPETHPAPISP